MAKARSIYVCQECGRTSPRPMGRCPDCGQWSSMVEEIEERGRSKPRTKSSDGSKSPQKLSEVQGDPDARWPLPIDEFARVLGGGVVPGSVVLIGGDPGIGKSTLLLQTALTMAVSSKVLYVSGEESEAQIKARALRLW
ncbi:MAG: AAA family ATPase, partial [Anaerolineales bacterium]